MERKDLGRKMKYRFQLSASPEIPAQCVITLSLGHSHECIWQTELEKKKKTSRCRNKSCIATGSPNLYGIYHTLASFFLRTVLSSFGLCHPSVPCSLRYCGSSTPHTLEKDLKILIKINLLLFRDAATPCPWATSRPFGH